MELRIFNEIEGKYDIDGIGNVIYDIAYSDISEKNKLDLYLPYEKKEYYPLLVFIHSGGFFKSDKKRHLSNILNGLLFGYAVASVNYRLNDETFYNGSRDDVIQALNYLSYLKNIDEKKILIWGESYGSYLALDIVVNHSDKLNFVPIGIIDMYCATDLMDFHQYKIEQNQEIMIRGKENDYHTFGDDLEKGIKESSFMEHFKGNEPPILIIHGLKDDIIPVRYSYALEKVLKQKKIEYEAHYLENMGHGIDNYADPEYNSIVFNFILKQMKKF